MIRHGAADGRCRRCRRRPAHQQTTNNPTGLLRHPNKLQAETYIKQANDYVQDAIKQITAKKTEL